MGLKEEFTREYKALAEDQRPVVLTISKMQAWALFSQLQLALRHPRNTGVTADIARTIAKGLEDTVATTPAIRTIARWGWDVKYDR